MLPYPPETLARRLRRRWAGDTGLDAQGHGGRGSGAFRKAHRGPGLGGDGWDPASRPDAARQPPRPAPLSFTSSSGGFVGCRGLAERQLEQGSKTQFLSLLSAASLGDSQVPHSLGLSFLIRDSGGEEGRAGVSSANLNSPFPSLRHCALALEFSP